MLKISDDAIEITIRFFEAIRILKRKRKIRGLKTFTTKYGINYWNMSTLEKEPHKRILKPEFIMYLVRDFNISSEWILLGTGDMMRHDCDLQKRNISEPE